jgi:hypothetical protein
MQTTYFFPYKVLKKQKFLFPLLYHYIPNTSLLLLSSNWGKVFFLPHFELVGSEGGTVILIGLVEDELLVLGAG